MPFSFSTQNVDIAHLIQVALTPIFLISAIGVTLNVLTSRLARIDRTRRFLEEYRSASDWLAGHPDAPAQAGLNRRERIADASSSGRSA